MVKLPPNLLIPGRGNAMPGVGLWKFSRGRWVYQKWPRKQPAARTEKEASNRRLLRQAAIIAPYLDSYQQEFSRALAKQTQLAARDHIFIALFGRIGTFIRQDGTKVFSMAAMQNVSAILDAIQQFKGGILVRGDAYWQGLEAGDLNQVLLMGPDGLPIWADQAAPPLPQIPGFMNAPPLNFFASTTFNPNFFTMLPIIPPRDVTLTGIEVAVAALGTSRQLLAGLYADHGRTPVGGALLRTAPLFTPAIGLNRIPFATPVNLVGNTIYWYGLTPIGGSGNLALYNGGVRQNAYAFFAQATGVLPATAPASTAGTDGTQFQWWGY